MSNAPGRGNASPSAIVSAVDTWLAENFREQYDLVALSLHVEKERSYICHTYRRETGTTISRKIRQLRVGEAARMLEERECSVAESSKAVGYASVSHFTKAFHAEMGSRPSGWIRKRKN